MKAKPNAALSVPYEGPASGVMQVRVAGDKPVTVYAIPRESLGAYKQKQPQFVAFSMSPLAREHAFVVRVPPNAPWNLIVENPWDEAIEVNTVATELAPVNVSGAVVTPTPRVTGSVSVGAMTSAGSATVGGPMMVTSTLERPPPPRGDPFRRRRMLESEIDEDDVTNPKA